MKHLPSKKKKHHTTQLVETWCCSGRKLLGWHCPLNTAPKTSCHKTDRQEQEETVSPSGNSGANVEDLNRNSSEVMWNQLTVHSSAGALGKHGYPHSGTQ